MLATVSLSNHGLVFRSRFRPVLVAGVLLAFGFWPGCSNGQQEDSEQSTKSMDAEQLLRFLTGDTTYFDANLSFLGFSIESIEEIEPPEWEQKHGALTTLIWHLEGPDATDAVIFTVFPSVVGFRQLGQTRRKALVAVRVVVSCSATGASCSYRRQQ